VVHVRRIALPLPFIILVAIFLFAPACGGDDESGDSSTGDDPAPGSEPVRYLAIGDSLSQGIGANDIETEAFPARLAARWRDAGCTVELLNAGISGYTAGQMLAEQVPQIDAFAPTVITFQSGANDIANGVTEDEYRENVGAVMDAAIASGARTYVLLQNEWFRAPEGPNYGGTPELRDAYDAIMLEEAESRGLEVLDLRPLYSEQADAGEWVDDGIHPTAGAYDAWSEALAEMIPLSCGA
jgi:lysophospholipase L1-like esterase